MTKVTSAIAKKVYPIIEASMKKNTKAYKDNIQKFLQVRAQDLYDVVPAKRIPFLENDNQMFFTAIKVAKPQITECLKDTYYWNMNFNPRAAKDEFTVAMMMVIRYFILNNKDSDTEISAIYLAFSGKFYPSVHYSMFPMAPDKYRGVLEYVLNNEMNNKHDLKREGSVFGAVRSICRTWIKTYTPKFKDPDDEDIADIIQQLHGRLKSFMNNIATLYYAAYERKDFLVYSSDSGDDETFRVADTDSLAAERCVETTMNMITTKGVSYANCKRATNADITTDEIKSVIESIQQDPNNIILIRELLQCIVFVYYKNSKTKDVRSYDFIKKALQPKPNSKDTTVIRQKEIIETLLNENCPRYRKRKGRQSTRQSYHKAVLIYYTLMINEANK